MRFLRVKDLANNMQIKGVKGFCLQLLSSSVIVLSDLCGDE